MTGTLAAVAAEQASSTSTNWVSTYLWASAILAIPMYIRLLRTFQPFGVNRKKPDRFTGPASGRWRIRTFTGVVANASTSESVMTSGSIHGSPAYPGSDYGGGTNIRGHITSARIVSDRFHLIGADTEKSVQLVNFDANPAPGQIVSVAWASKGKQSPYFLVYNHNTRETSYNVKSILPVQVSHLWTSRASSLFYILTLNVFWIATAIVWERTKNVQTRSFYRRGIRPLLAQLEQHADQLRAATPAPAPAVAPAQFAPLPPPPVVSEDGRFWWNGEAWVPMPEARGANESSGQPNA